MVVRELLRWTSFVVLALCLGCAARPVTPVMMSQPGDDALSCEQLDQQIAANRNAAVELVRKDKEVEQGNTAKIVAATVFSVWLAMSIDLSHEEQIVMRSLYDRNERLVALKQVKSCPVA